jgi:hypothetical protein
MAATRAQPTPRLADRLAAARHAAFVGRAAELEAFASALAAAEPPFNVLFVHGPGGVGKTTLLHEYGRLAAAAGAQPLLIDGRGIDASPAGVLLALGEALQAAGTGASEGQSDSAGTGRVAAAFTPLDLLATQPRAVLFFDTCEVLAPLDAWFREVFVPQLGARTIIVFAGRHTPSPAWQELPGWGTLLRSIALRNLSPADSRAYLRGRGVADVQHASALEFTHGHPLALSIVADVLERRGPDARFVAEREPDAVRTLLEKFVADVPSAAHRRALRASSIARVTTESLLARVAPDADAAALFDWLAGLSFMQHGPHGLFPHDLARDVLHADFRWRDRAGHDERLERVFEYTMQRLRTARGLELLQVMTDGLFLSRDLPVFKPYYDWRRYMDCYGEPATPDDLPAILAMTERHEGPESARIVSYWFDRQPRAFLAVRGPGRQLIGYLALLELHDVTPEDCAFDPGTHVAWEYAQRHAPPRPGDEMLLQRHWMDHEAYQRSSVTFLVITAVLNAVYVTRPRLAWTFHPGAEPEYWVPILEFINFTRCPETDFEVGGRHYGTWVHDWRSEPGPMWIGGIAERSKLALRGAAIEPPAARPAPLLVLSETAFADAVRQALRGCTRSAALEASPLLRSRVLVDFAGDGQCTPAALQRLIRAAAETLRGAPRTEKFYRAIERTYLEPARSQEKAAEQLGLPFNTYRYHLDKGTARITEWLWARELRGPEAETSAGRSVDRPAHEQPAEAHHRTLR